MRPRGGERGLYGIDWRRPATWLWLAGSALVLAAITGVTPLVAALVVERYPDLFAWTGDRYAIYGLAILLFFVLFYGILFAGSKIAGIGVFGETHTESGGAVFWIWLICSTALSTIVALVGKAHLGIAHLPITQGGFTVAACFVFWPDLVHVLPHWRDRPRHAAEG